MTTATLIHQCRALQRRFIRLRLDVFAQAAATHASDLLNPAFRRPERVALIRGWIGLLADEAERREGRATS